MQQDEQAESTFARSCRHWSAASRAEMEAFYKLASLDYRLLAEHTPSESYSVDGLIVASARRTDLTAVPISYRRPSEMALKEKFRWRLYRAGLYGVLNRVFRRRYPSLVRRALR